MTTEYFAVIVNSPADDSGKFQQQVRIVDRYQWHGVRNGIVLWDTRSMGEVRAWDPNLLGWYTIPWYNLEENAGIYKKAYGGHNNGIPYIDNYTQDGYVDDWIEGHKLWMLDNYGATIPVWSVKGYLYQIPDGASNKLATMNTIIEATYTATPLNKIRWEQREFMSWGDPLYLLIQEELGMTHFALKKELDFIIPASYNEYNENDLT